jgi:RNA polymerase sigma-70 factor (ECF subfamily)
VETIMHDEHMASRLKAGDEAAFREIVAEYGGRMARLARSFSRNDAVIEEAVQETWLAVIRGIGGFEGRSSLRTWIFGILINQARRLAVREYRHAQVSHGGNIARPPSANSDDPDGPEPGMGSNGMWVEPPAPWGLEDPESAILSRETLGVIEAALAALSEAQRQVVLLRDVEGMGADEVCNILGVSDTNARVLLHRGRAGVRRALDRYIREGTLEAPPARTGRT